MFSAFFQGFLDEITGNYKPVIPTYKRNPLSRPTRKRMKRFLAETLRQHPDQYRCRLEIRGREYHAIYFYWRSAIFTLTYEFTGKRLKFPKLVSYHNGRPSLQHLRQEIEYEAKRKRARIARAFTVGK